MRGWVGDKIAVDFPGISERFETTVILRDDMMTVTRLQGGWGIAIGVARSNVRCLVLGENGVPQDVPYWQVAHWTDASHPRVKTPRGTFLVLYETEEEARAEGFGLWFTHNGVPIYGDGTVAGAVGATFRATLAQAV
jgi:hypothetical protein